jgi:hypothetical protein
MLFPLYQRRQRNLPPLARNRGNPATLIPGQHHHVSRHHQIRRIGEKPLAVCQSVKPLA